MKKTISILIIIIIFITGCKSDKESEEKEINLGNVTINLEKYNKVEIGISYEELINIVGEGCTKTKEDDSTIYVCSGIKAGTSAKFTFKGNKLISKNETGLE